MGAPLFSQDNKLLHLAVYLTSVIFFLEYFSFTVFKFF